MSQLGLGVMIQALGSNGKESAEAVAGSIGKTITEVAVERGGDQLRISFNDGSALIITDDGQSCCEYRHMTCDDALDYYKGATLTKIELRDAPAVEGEYDVHEITFLDVTTSKGVFQVANHNEHNGYYGGFWIVARVENAPAGAANA